VSHLIVSCRECGAAVGSECRYVEQRRKGQLLVGGHRIRQAEAEGWRTSEETAMSIADWLESFIPTARRAMPERADWYRDIAAEIRRGEWRKGRTP
jgi:hypothetical protein